MRLITILLMSAICSSVYAADQSKPAGLKALPPPTFDTNEDVDVPQVTIIHRKGQTVEEFRFSGKLYMIKITPKIGLPYYMVDDLGDGKFTRMESMDSRVRPPRWVIHRF